MNHGPKTPVTLKLCALGTGCSSRRRRQAEGIRNNLFLICAPGQKETPQNEIIPWPQSAAAQQQQQRSIIKQKKKLQEQQQQQQRPENRFPSSKRFDENFDCVLKEGEKEGEEELELELKLGQECGKHVSFGLRLKELGLGLGRGTGSRGVAPAPALSQGSSRWKIVNIAKKAKKAPL